MRRVALALLFVFSAILGSAAWAQAPTTGIELHVADWLEPWDAAAGGGWTAVPAGQRIKTPRPVTEMTAAFTPGSYDVYWIQDADLAPLLIAAGVTVTEGAVTQVAAATGLLVETADWVPPRDPEHGWIGAILPTAMSFDFINWTRAGNSMFLPPGQYDVFYMQDETSELPAIWLGVYGVEEPFGGLGLEVAAAPGNGGAIDVVRAQPGGPAANAGVLAGDTIVAIDGAQLMGLALAESVDLLRGAPDTEVVLTINRGANETLDITITREIVAPTRIIRAYGGIRLVLPPGVAIGPNGWWGINYEGEGPDTLINWADGTAAAPLLAGPATYDVYWNRDGTGAAELVAAGVAVDGTLVEVSPPNRTK
jgi:hypothetical protein